MATSKTTRWRWWRCARKYATTNSAAASPYGFVRHGCGAEADAGRDGLVSNEAGEPDHEERHGGNIRDRVRGIRDAHEGPESEEQRSNGGHPRRCERASRQVRGHHPNQQREKRHQRHHRCRREGAPRQSPNSGKQQWISRNMKLVVGSRPRKAVIPVRGDIRAEPVEVENHREVEENNNEGGGCDG
jgi:hypothetical protein